MQLTFPQGRGEGPVFTLNDWEEITGEKESGIQRVEVGSKMTPRIVPTIPVISLVYLPSWSSGIPMKTVMSACTEPCAGQLPGTGGSGNGPSSFPLNCSMPLRLAGLEGDF